MGRLSLMLANKRARRTLSGKKAPGSFKKSSAERPLLEEKIKERDKEKGKMTSIRSR